MVSIIYILSKIKSFGLRALLLILVGFVSLSCFAQGQYILFVDGTVKEGKSKLVGSTVTVYEDGDKFGAIVTNASGKFGFELMMDHEYIIEFSKSGYVSKKISVSTKGVPEDEAEFGFEFGGWQVGLFKNMEGLDVSILDNPVGKIFYVEADNGFDYDAKYTKSIRQELAQLQSDLAEKLEAQKIAEQNYKRAIASADKALGVSNYIEAIAKYTIALEAKVGDSYAAGKLAEAELKAQEEDAAQAAEAAKEDEFDDLMARADAKFKAKDYDGAKAGYTSAIGVKPNEKLPKDQIKKIDDLLAKAAEEERLAEEAEAKRLADEQAAEESRLKAEAEEKRLAEEAETKRLADLKAAEEERLAKLAADRIAAEQKEAKAVQEEEERLAEAAAAKATADRIAAEQKEAKAFQEEEERLAEVAAAKAKADRIAAEQKEAKAVQEEEERIAKAALAKATADRIAAEQKEAKVAQEEEERIAKAAADNAETNRLAKEAVDKAEADRLALIKADQETARLKSAEAEATVEAERLARLDKISSEQYSLSEYRDVIDKADLHYNFKKYEAALTEYQNALAMRPDQDYPKERISLIKKMIGIQANKEILAQENQEIQQISIEDFKNDIAKKYPEGITEEVETLGNKTITKRYVVKDNRGDEYKMIKHNWGGKFFFKNEQQITELIWNDETEH